MELTINKQAHEVEQVTIVCSMREAHLLSVASDLLAQELEKGGTYEKSVLEALNVTPTELYETVETLYTTLPGIPDEEEV